MRILPSGAPVLTAAAMRAAEAAAFAAGLSQDGAMEAAGAAAARESRRFAGGRPILVLAGPGNNGGDAYVAARLLRQAGHDVVLAALGSPKEGAAARMADAWGGHVIPLAEAPPRPVLVDGLFGTGMRRPLDKGVAADLHRLIGAADFSLAIDLASGLDTDTGKDLGAARVTATVALGALKPAHLIGPGAVLSGHVLLADIGIPVASGWRSLARPGISAPAPDSHKYSRGLVVVLAGAMLGAARLAARAALRGGAGYTILAGTAPGGPDALVHRGIASGKELEALLDDDRIAALLLGPGLGRGGDASARLDAVLGSPHPLVLDGDALSLLGRRAAERLRQRRAVTVLTPHSGEFERMFGGAGSKIDRTLAAAGESGATVVHKGPDTVIASPDGAVTIAAGSSSWLSTAGTGDVLAGLVAARLAVTRESAIAAGEAAWLHARAASLAGPSFVADDLIGRIPQAIGECL